MGRLVIAYPRVRRQANGFYPSDIILCCPTFKYAFHDAPFCSIPFRISIERGIPRDGDTPTSLDPLSSDRKIRFERYSLTNMLFDAALERMMFLRLLGIERFDCSVSFIRYYLCRGFCEKCVFYVFFGDDTKLSHSLWGKNKHVEFCHECQPAEP